MSGPDGRGVADAVPAADLRKLFATFGATEGREYAPLYVRLGAAIAADDEVLALLAAAPVARRSPQLLFAAVHDLVLAHPDAPLARWYPSVTGGPVPDGDAFPAFRAFLAEHEPAVRERLATRTVQTNEVNRCAAVAPALQVVARQGDTPLAVVEVGCSGGLNLWFDRFAYDLGRGPEGAVGSPVRVRAEPRGPLRPPPVDPLPDVAVRLGIDPAPADLWDDASVRWLQACVWPEHPERHRRLRAAVELARAEPPPVEVGDALGSLPRVLADLPDGVVPVVAHTWVLYYLTPQDRARFLGVLEDAARRRPLWWVSLEWPGVVPGVVPPPVPATEPAKERYASVLGLVGLDGDRRRDRVLARSHPHVTWLEWRDADSAGPSPD